MKIRVLTNVKNLSSSNFEDIDVVMMPENSNILNIRNIAQCFSMLTTYDYILFGGSLFSYQLGLLNLLLPGRKCKIWALDLWLAPPQLCNTPMKKIKKLVQSLCLKGIDRFMLHSKNNNALCRAYGINPANISYVPFKINSYDFVVNHPTSDEGYIFSGGYSRRDYGSLIDACRGLPVNVKIVTPVEEFAKLHRTVYDRSNVPPNVEIINDDGSSESFVNFIAKSKFVVIPTMKLDFAATGIGVYLVSMALGKCVVITSGPASDLILSDKQAVIVPPEDPVSLRTAIERVDTDNEYRTRIAEAGQKYALSLGGENTYFTAILNEIASEAFSSAK